MDYPLADRGRIHKILLESSLNFLRYFADGHTHTDTRAITIPLRVAGGVMTKYKHVLQAYADNAAECVYRRKNVYTILWAILSDCE
jgi:hypothetical protein